MCGPQIRLSLFTFRPIIGNASALGVQFPASARVFMFEFLFCCCVFTFCPKTRNLSQNFKIPFAML